MQDNSPAEHAYTMGYDENFQQLLRRRSAESHAAYLLPHLKPGYRVLDFGCGPGTISLGLAKAVEPGELHGVDMEESQIEMARAAAQAGGHTNATFHVGDVTALPFEDNFFDAAHCHAVLMHVPDTRAVLAEVKRVLKSGGIIAAREMFVSSSFLEPGGQDVDGAWDTFARLLQGNGGYPHMGRELKNALLEAGFANILASGSFDYFGSAEDVAFFPRLHRRLVLLAAGHRGGGAVRAGEPRAVRPVEAGTGRVARPPGRLRRPGLRRGHRREAVGAGV